jgi:hypothetical protein
MDAIRLIARRPERMRYDIRVAAQPRRPIAAVAVTTTWPEYPAELQTEIFCGLVSRAAS